MCNAGIGSLPVTRIGGSYDKDIIFMQLPPHTTAEAQPLDKFFFRMWKGFANKIYVHASIYDVQERVGRRTEAIRLARRDNAIKLQSMIHNQFSAPRFLEFRRHAWQMCGYAECDILPERFLHPVQYSFALDIDLYCSAASCNKPTLLRCGYCEVCLCFEHFYTDYHVHF